MTEYHQQIPLIACESHGGPYEDQAYCAGFELGSLFEILAQGPAVHQAKVHSNNLPQIDLIAMNFGYVIETEIEGEAAVVILRKTVVD